MASDTSEKAVKAKSTPRSMLHCNTYRTFEHPQYFFKRSVMRLGSRCFSANRFLDERGVGCGPSHGAEHISALLGRQVSGAF